MRALGLAVLVTTMASCTQSDADSAAPRAVRTDSTGVTIVLNAGADRALPWRFTRHLSIGGEESGPASFYRVRSVDTDGRGNLYVLDASAHRVVVFDSTGAVVRAMGRRGGGPGEMQWPHQLMVMSDGGVAVHDLGRPGLVAFDSAGVPRSADLPMLPEGSRPDALRQAGDGWYLLLEDWLNEAPVVRRRLVHHAGSAERELARVERARPKEIAFERCDLRAALSPVFEPTLEWDARDGRVVLSRGTGYVLDVHDGDRQTASYRRDVAPRPATPALAIQQLGKGLVVKWASGTCTITPAETVERQGVAPVIPAVGGVRLAPDGHLFVLRGQVKGDPALIDVLSPVGDYLGTLPAGSPMPAAFLPNGDVVAIELDDETDVQRVVTYRVERGVAEKP